MFFRRTSHVTSKKVPDGSTHTAGDQKEWAWIRGRCEREGRGTYQQVPLSPICALRGSNRTQADVIRSEAVLGTETQVYPDHRSILSKGQGAQSGGAQEDNHRARAEPSPIHNGLKKRGRALGSVRLSTKRKRKKKKFCR